MIENQADAIRQYAERRGIEIVRTYADEGLTGLRLDGRDALKQLIEDVQSGKPRVYQSWRRVMSVFVQVHRPHQPRGLDARLVLLTPRLPACDIGPILLGGVQADA